jgi:hypothetical protein
MTIVQEFEQILRRQADQELQRLATWRTEREGARRQAEVQRLIRKGYAAAQAQEQVQHAFYDDTDVFREWKERADEVRQALARKLKALYAWAPQTGRLAA